MFTGLVTDVGVVRSREARGDHRFEIATAYDIASVAMGASIACNGVCLTVVAKTKDSFFVDVSAETLDVTTLDSWQEGTLVNLERSLRLGDEMGGHIVSGHVDAVAEIITWETTGDSILMRVSVDGVHRGLLAGKGSVAVNGVSLTVNRVEDLSDHAVFDINLIPHTQDVTAFKTAATGDRVNIEFDMLARYVSRLEAVRAASR